LNQRQWTKLENTLVLGDPTGQLIDAWIIAQELMLLYKPSHDLADAKHRLWKILNRCARSETPELLRLARTLDAWQGELLAAFNATGRCPASNGPTEAVNMLIKKIKRIGHGFRNLANYRLRLLLAVGLDWRAVHWLPPPPRSEAAHHAWWRRAMKADTPPRAPALFRFRLVPKLSAWRDRPASRRSSSSRVPLSAAATARSFRATCSPSYARRPGRPAVISAYNSADRLPVLYPSGVTPPDIAADLPVLAKRSS